MAGFSIIYCIGGVGGYQGADGINPIDMQIWVGDADRQWYEAHYFKKNIRPIGLIKRLIPVGPDDENALLDCCIAFYPDLFQSCPSLAGIKKELQSCSFLDFNAKENIPKNWGKLREEARPIFKKMSIFKGELKLMH